MARSRNIKPGLFDNEILGEADPIYSLAFIGIWTIADKEGRLEDRPKKIRAMIFPYRSDVDMEEILAWLNVNSFISRYQSKHGPCIAVVNWSKHQRPHHKEKDSELEPERPVITGHSQEQAKHDSSMVQEQAKHDSSMAVLGQPNPPDTGYRIPDSLNTDSLIPDSGLIDSPEKQKDQSINHSRLLNCLSDFGFPASYRTDPKVIEASKDLIIRGMTVDLFTEAIQKSIDESTSKGLPPWNFIQSVSDGLIVKRFGKRKHSVHGDFSKRDYAKDPALEKYNVAGGEL